MLQGECEDADLSDAEKVYAECGQQHPLLWEECIIPQRMKQCIKIGEGTFGEVFSMTNTSGEAVALKVCEFLCRFVCFALFHLKVKCDGNHVTF